MTLNLIGSKFGRLTVVAKTSERSGKSIVWHCHCLCGNVNAKIPARDLVHGNRKGCGICNDVKHPLYGTWRSIISRCEDSNNPSYKDYGGRGIRICDRWRKEFLRFIADVGERKSIFFSIDRIDVNGNYEPGNVRWADSQQQANNKRPVTHGLKNNEIIEIYYSKDSVKILSEKFSVTEKTIRNIKAMSYSSSATSVIVDHMMGKIKSTIYAPASPDVASL